MTDPTAAATTAPGGPSAPRDDETDSLAREQADFAAAQTGGGTPWTETLWARIGIPVLIGVVFLAGWEAVVRINEIPKFVLPAPSLIWEALIADFWSLMGSLWITLKVTIQAFVLAVIGGVALAVLFSQSRLVEVGLFPYAVILQVTPVVSIAPLIIIWVGFDNVHQALLILAWIVAFFPILSNTTLGLRSADHNLVNLFRLYGASRWQILTQLQLPSALPYLLGGMKISGGLALIGAVVAEFVAGSGSAAGLAWRIIEGGNRLNIPKMFAALLLMSLTGIAIFMALHTLQHVMLRKWHESALKRES
jgi:NitT/TauT family transport system permease protein